MFVQIIFVIVANVGCTYYTENKEKIENLIDKIITWYNSIPSERLILLTNHQTGSKKLGVVFELDKNKEIRIQYTSKGEIFVTTFPPFSNLQG